jgi:hypothetical protein
MHLSRQAGMKVYFALHSPWEPGISKTPTGIVLPKGADLSVCEIAR